MLIKYINVGRSVGILIKRKRISQSELAESLGMTRQRVSMILSQRTVQSRVLDKLCDYFQMSASELVEIGQDYE